MLPIWREIMKSNNPQKKIIPIFYAVDDGYIPYLIVSLNDLKQNVDKEYRCEIHILTEGISVAAEEKLKKYETEFFRVQCIDISHRLEEIKSFLHLRDYYTGATYYRIFIAGMFPQYDKALYFDSDTVILGDVAELYNTDIGNNLVGAIPDGAVAVVPEFCTYTKEVLDIEAERYFNAGVLLMNLSAFREYDFYQKFCKLLKAYQFSVAQDQDYLNVLCKGRVKCIGGEWNRMPIGGKDKDVPKLIHYNLTMKPWHYDNILYQEYFWEYAAGTDDYPLLLQSLKDYSARQKEQDAKSEETLKALALQEANRVDNYRKRFL